MIDGARFRRLAASQWAERCREWLAFLGVVVALQLINLVIILWGHDGFRSMRLEEQDARFWFGLFLASLIFACRYFLPLSRRDAGLTILMRPASNAEKYLLAFLVIVVAFPLAYTVAFYLTDVPAAAWARLRAIDVWAALSPTAKQEQSGWDPSLYGILRPRWGWQLVDDALAFVALCTLLGWSVFGTLYFRSSPLVRTFVAGFVLFLAVLLISKWTGGDMSRLFVFWRSTTLMPGWQRVAAGAAWVVVPVLAWWSCYLALRERESP